jgi:HAD superfamily hydrolase (TIGR01509 family)
MISAMVFDFSNVLLFSRNRDYRGLLTTLHKKLQKKTDYSVLDQFELNEELLNYLETIKEQCDLYLFTASTIQEQKEIRVRLDRVFKDVFSTVSLGLNKQEPAAFFQIAELIQHYPSEILFVDDREENVMAAEEAGFKGIRYVNNEQIIHELKAVLIKSNV